MGIIFRIWCTFTIMFLAGYLLTLGFYLEETDRWYGDYKKFKGIFRKDIEVFEKTYTIGEWLHIVFTYLLGFQACIFPIFIIYLVWYMPETN